MKSRQRRGYTIVELMMSLAVLAIGVSGIISMQKVTLASNQHAKNLAIATHIGQAWLDALAGEAGQWVQGGNFTNTTWLSNVASADWFRPGWDNERELGAAFNALGTPISDDAADAHAQFCVDLKLQWLHSDTVPETGGGLIRAQVRVFWRREGVVDLAGSAPLQPCSVSAVNVTNADGLKLFHFVYLTSAIRQYTLPE